MTGWDLRDRAARVAIALRRWAESELPPDIVPALCCELRLVERAIAAEEHAIAANAVRVAVTR